MNRRPPATLNDLRDEIEDLKYNHFAGLRERLVRVEVVASTGLLIGLAVLGIVAAVLARGG